MSDIVKGQFSFAIREENIPLEEMLAKIDAYHIQGKLTDDERDALYAEARQKAIDNFPDTVNIVDTLTSFGRRIGILEAAIVEIQRRIDTLPPPDDDDEEEEPPEYVDGKWYYDGDRVTYNGYRYTCDAPENFPVVWSPDVTPQYWIKDDE